MQIHLAKVSSCQHLDHTKVRLDAEWQFSSWKKCGIWTRENRGLYQIPALSSWACLNKPLLFDIHLVIKLLPYRF